VLAVELVAEPDSRHAHDPHAPLARVDLARIHRVPVDVAPALGVIAEVLLDEDSERGELGEQGARPSWACRLAAIDVVVPGRRRLGERLVLALELALKLANAADSTVAVIACGPVRVDTIRFRNLSEYRATGSPCPCTGSVRRRRSRHRQATTTRHMGTCLQSSQLSNIDDFRATNRMAGR
jgi:hypothetical protein